MPENATAWQGKSVAISDMISKTPLMSEKELLTEADLTALAKRLREKAGITRAQAARDMGVSQTSIFHAEESPALSYLKLRTRMIGAYSPFKVFGPVFQLRKK